MLTLRFDHPAYLWLALAAIPLLIIGWRAMALTDPLRRWVILLLRTALLIALTIMLAGPRIHREHDHLTVIGLLDISGSVKRFGGSGLLPTSPIAVDDNSEDPSLQTQDSIIEHLRSWFRTATQIKTPDDRFGLIVFDGEAIAISAPTRADYVDDNLDTSIAPGTNIEEALRLALAMFPPDTAKRIVLVTDGNETSGSVLNAIGRLNEGQIALNQNANGESQIANLKSKIPIDVLPIAYRVDRDVQVVRVEAPPSAQPGQTVTVRIVVESTMPTTGVLTLVRENEPVPIGGGDDDGVGFGRRIAVPAGQSIHIAQVTLGHTPVNRFEAVFETDDPTHNILPDNDRAESFTATPSQGSVLVLDAKAQQRDSTLAQILNDADIPAIVQAPAQFPTDLLSLHNYDLIVLDNIGAYELTAQQQELISRYVNDLGGGLIMAGGENSFGAGGWRGSPVADLLPVNVDPSRELRLPTAALVLVLDKSGSMNHPVAGARATQQYIANEGAALAIQSLHSDNLVGVITFDMGAYTLVPLQRNDDPKAIANRVRSITAEGGTNMEPALLRAFEMLRDVEVARKRVVFLTDGRSSSDEGLDDIAAAMAAEDIQLTTIAVGDDADYETLERLAQIGGGEFRPVRDPRRLPVVLMDSVQTINKPLIKEVTFTPTVLPTGSTLTVGMGATGNDAPPPLNGLVITSVREDPKVWLEMVDPDGEPLLAHWQAGLGRVAAFTSEAPGSGPWAESWADWPTAATFWSQLARMMARPSTNQDAELIAVIQDDRLNITYDVEVNDNRGEPLSYLQVEGTVYQPDGTAVPVRLRQTGPTRYETSMDTALAGNYIVALNPRQGTRQLPPAIGGANRSSNPEFRKYVSNLALLEEIVETSGGRRLNIEQPLAMDLFDRTNMPPSVSSLPAWRTVLLLTLALLLLDVASRRIAWDSHVLRAMFASAIARVRPARVRGAEVTATLATLRRVSDEIGARQESASAGLQRLKGTGRIAPPPLRDADSSLLTQTASAPSGASRASEGETAKDKRSVDVPDESKVSAALDALLGRTKPAPPPVETPTKSDAGISATETTGNLLAAKRRARERLQDGSS